MRLSWRIRASDGNYTPDQLLFLTVSISMKLRIFLTCCFYVYIFCLDNLLTPCFAFSLYASLSFVIFVFLLDFTLMPFEIILVFPSHLSILRQLWTSIKKQTLHNIFPLVSCLFPIWNLLMDIFIVRAESTNFDTHGIVPHEDAWEFNFDKTSLLILFCAIFTHRGTNLTELVSQTIQ